MNARGSQAQGHPPEPGGNQDAAEAASGLPAQALSCARMEEVVGGLNLDGLPAGLLRDTVNMRLVDDFVVEGLSYGDIALRLNISEALARKCFELGRRRLAGPGEP